MIEVIQTVRRVDDGREFPVYDGRFMRREYPVTQVLEFVSSARRRTLQANTSDVKFLYIVAPDGNDVPVRVFKNLSPEYWTFTERFIMFEVANCTGVSFSSDSDVKLNILVCGE